jgi:hypothetical protein
MMANDNNHGKVSVKIREPITRLTMVRPYVLLVRQRSQPPLAIQVEDFYYGHAFDSHRSLFISEWDQMRCRKREQAEDKTTVFVSSAQDLNHSPVDEEWYMVNRVSQVLGERLFKIMMLFD